MRIGIGDFSLMTHLSIKALRHYHDIGVLVPGYVDPVSGYRFYDVDQTPVAQVIRRLRDLGMPLQQIRSVLMASDLQRRNGLIAEHLARMEEQLAHNQAVVSSLRSLLDRTEAQAFSIEHRSVPAMLGLAVSESVTGADLDEWWGAAFDALRAELRRAGATAAAPAGALYPAEFFQLDKAEVVAFIPVTEPITSGRSQTIEIPGADLAIAVHVGALGEIDQTYAALGRHVVLDAIGMAGPIREYYLVTADHTPDESRHRTEVCWPILPTSVS